MKKKDIKQLNKEDREKKLEELKFELIKSKAKAGSSRAREIRRMIARIFTFNNKTVEQKNKHGNMSKMRLA